jgi:hypothetical protein
MSKIAIFSANQLCISDVISAAAFGAGTAVELVGCSQLLDGERAPSPVDDAVATRGSKASKDSVIRSGIDARIMRLSPRCGAPGGDRWPRSKT